MYHQCHVCSVDSVYTIQGPAGDHQYAGGWAFSASRRSEVDTCEDTTAAKQVRPITTRYILLLYRIADVLSKQVLKRNTKRSGA
jgi:hypothetical protein